MGAAAQKSRRLLPAQPSSVGAARRLIRGWLIDAGRAELADDAELAVSEIVTNALLHAGTSVELSARMDVGFVRVEVTDGSSHLPRSRDFDTVSGTGRGLKLLDRTVARWGAERRGAGKVVWFELGDLTASTAEGGIDDRGHLADPGAVTVELLDVPLLLISAWLEHAETLLREYLLIHLDEDAERALSRHAAASATLTLLEEQWPELDLGLSPDELLAGAVEPRVSAPRLELVVPTGSAEGFVELNELIEEALVLADRGEMLTPPTQPEIRVMRRRLIEEVCDQVAGAAPRPLTWSAGDQMPTRDQVHWDADAVDRAATACVAADDTDRIVAVSDAALELLGHDRAALTGKRLLELIPTRFRQAHLAGFTLHLINGRAPLLGVPITVPMLCADGSERPVELTITAHRLPHGRAVFVAAMRSA